MRPNVTAHFALLYICWFFNGRAIVAKIKNSSESYFHALHDVTTGRAKSHGFRGWTGNGDARNAHRSAAQNGNGSGRETGGSLVSLSSPSSSNISGRHGQRNTELSVRGPGILSLDLRNTSAAFSHCYRFLRTRQKPQNRRLVCDSKRLLLIYTHCCMRPLSEIKTLMNR